ncbi:MULTISPECIES: alanine/glycine:cation symporter family protein [Kocuria]|uniref:Alanine:cation symporter family protein n=1 Tax=Kocuria subflava TaxID=1736139 RepID=A0A846TND6_9MICC|nr:MULTISPECIES: alanine/glycine:cation symporter family protein [unclassified Kocuria]NKE08460.1 alanine:cation symporter family protein [Kocuria subflava]
MEQLIDLVGVVDTWIWYFVFIILVGSGVFLTIRTRAVQWRSIPEMFRVLGDPPGEDPDGKKGISSFRAFTVSAASRVGTGNIAGVALAISLGGPGAVFWMWFIAAIGGASAFVESLLGQLYKRTGHHGYYGGPAYYMTHGLNKKWMGALFAVIITVTYAFVFNSVQSNAIVDSLAGSFDVDTTSPDSMMFKVLVGLAIVVLTALIIFGGIRRISAFTQAIVPIMAILYVILGLLVVVLNITEVPNMIADIVLGAFGVREFAVGSLFGVFMLGMQRGLFSNEAGMGSAPNAGATASISHPAKQGYVQSLGVYFDTWLICSMTAFIVLLSNPTVGESAQGAALTQSALAAQLGDWAIHFLTISIFLFAVSSVIGNYFYGEANIMFLTGSRGAMLAFRITVLVFVMMGAVAALELVWALANVSMALMVTINLIAVVLLSGVAAKVLKNYEAQRRRGEEPVFTGSDVPGLTGLDAWDGSDRVTTSMFWTQQLKKVKR